MLQELILLQELIVCTQMSQSRALRSRSGLFLEELTVSQNDPLAPEVAPPSARPRHAPPHILSRLLG